MICKNSYAIKRTAQNTSWKYGVVCNVVRANDTSFGRIQVKQITKPDGAKVIVPEYEVCRDIAIEKKNSG